MAISQDLVSYLIPLAGQVGGMAVLETLPEEAIVMASTHIDDVLGVSFLDPNFEITLLDQAIGYTLHNRHFEPIYTENTASGLDGDIWGNTKNDRLWVGKATVGEWAYLSYFMLDGTKRVAMILRV